MRLTSFELFKSATIAPRSFCCCFKRDKRPVNLHIAGLRMQVAGGWWWWWWWRSGYREGGVEVKRVADEEGHGGKRRVGEWCA